MRSFPPGCLATGDVGIMAAAAIVGVILGKLYASVRYPDPEKHSTLNPKLKVAFLCLLAAGGVWLYMTLSGPSGEEGDGNRPARPRTVLTELKRPTVRMTRIRRSRRRTSHSLVPEKEAVPLRSPSCPEAAGNERFSSSMMPSAISRKTGQATSEPESPPSTSTTIT